MTDIVFGERPITVEDVLAASVGGVRINVTAALHNRMLRTRSILDAHLGDGAAIYGLNTGMGANTRHRMTAEEAAAGQADLVRPRAAAVGPALSLGVCRAVLFCRLSGLSGAGAGVSIAVFDQIGEMLARDIIPVIHSYGSTGASDLVQVMSIAAAATGEGPVYWEGRQVPAREALAAAGMEPVRLAAKDGLSIGSSSAVACATGALALVELEALISMHVAVAALACQGFGAYPQLFDARVALARPAAMQVEAATRFRHALKGSDFFDREAARIQDPISFRALPQVTGALLQACAEARREVEIELNSTSDNPLVLADEAIVLPSANFLTTSLALAFDKLAIANAHLASGSVQRSIKLMTGRLSGLPNYLSPVGGVSAGFVPIQKTLAALQADIRLRANPASLDTPVVSDMVEDLGSNVGTTIAKLHDQLEPLRWLISIEAMAAAQAVDLRRDNGPGMILGAAAGIVYDAVRQVAPILVADRPTGPDAMSIHENLWVRSRQDAVAAALNPVSGD